MSNFQRFTVNPKTGVVEKADWMSNHFDGHKYGVKFPDGEIYNPDDTLLKTFQNCPIENCNNYIFDEENICDRCEEKKIAG